MSTPDLSAKLPPPHDEEPAQLRSDILDELQDHLSCAAERERRRLQLSDQPTDQTSIWTAVIERFGDPSALARRLWFDAMKGRLMTQRVLLGAVAVLTALMCVMVVGSWKMTSTLSTVVEQNQKATAAILERMGKEAPATTTPEWIAVKYRLVQSTTDGPPVVCQKVNLSQSAESEKGRGRLQQISEVTNSEGIADFGLLPYGTYSLSIDSATGQLNEGITLRPGRPIDATIVVPNAPKMVHVKFEYSRPDMTSWKWKKEQQLREQLMKMGLSGKQSVEQERRLSPESLGEMITPCLCVKYSRLRYPQFEGRIWSNAEYSGLVIVRPEGTFKIQTVSSVPTLLDSSAAMESVSMPATDMAIHAEWYYLTKELVDVSGSTSGYMPLNPISDLLDDQFVAENLQNAKSSPDKLLESLKLESAPDPKVVSFPGNHPGLIDGTRIDMGFFPQGFNGGSGGGGGFF